ncbi:MAG: oligoendopeptidase F family protein [Pseudomonadota bacterium]|nr:oligoendopeptidase F family protein [Pseudomonadota bacterium]
MIRQPSPLSRSLAIGAACALLHGMAPAAESPPTSADARLHWDLGDLYPSADAWTASYRKTRIAAEKIGQLKGTLGADAASMRRALTTLSDLRRETARLSCYANLLADEDLRVAPAQERRQQAQSLRTLLGENSAWLAPEVIAIGREKVDAFLALDALLRQHFDFLLRDILRNAPHTLSPEAEAILAASGNVLAQPNNIFQQLADAEMPFATIELSGGEKVRLDQAAYKKFRTAASRADRKAVFDAFWGSWKNYQGTLGATLDTQVIGDIFSARARRFDTALDEALFSDNMPPTVYRTLVAQTNAALPTLHRYLRLRKRLLHIDGELAYYDNYPSLFPTSAAPRFSVEKSERLTLAALAPMGDEYLGLLRRGFAGRWMDALPRRGKRSGAYMNGAAYDVHPYLLLNHNDNYESLSTLAHEWGHAVHTLLAQAQQPFEKARYSTFIAESASIGNEMLLNDYMVNNAKSRDEKLYYLGQGLESIRTTFFRQVMFAEFQLQMHEEVEQGRPLSGERLTQLYCTLLRRYYGEAEGVMKIDPLYCTEWEYVPHFYYGYYVYQYATSMAGAAEFTDAILKEGAPARDRFLTMLKAGGSDYGYELYKRAGIDMASPAPYQALVARMNRVMDEIEALERTKP